MSWVKQLGKGVKELRFIVCQTSDRSAGARSYILKNYWQWKEQQPDFPFIVRECEEVDPYILVRYRFGVEKKAFISNLDEQELEQVVSQLVGEAQKVNATI
ncbi:hypothetical protein pb186bvf_006014 [Paramecium bursaria]